MKATTQAVGIQIRGADPHPSPAGRGKSPFTCLPLRARADAHRKGGAASLLHARNPSWRNREERIPTGSTLAVRDRRPLSEPAPDSNTES